MNFFIKLKELSNEISEIIELPNCRSFLISLTLILMYLWTVIYDFFFFKTDAVSFLVFYTLFGSFVFPVYVPQDTLLSPHFECYDTYPNTKKVSLKKIFIISFIMAIAGAACYFFIKYENNSRNLYVPSFLFTFQIFIFIFIFVLNMLSTFISSRLTFILFYGLFVNFYYVGWLPDRDAYYKNKKTLKYKGDPQAVTKQKYYDYDSKLIIKPNISNFNIFSGEEKKISYNIKNVGKGGAFSVSVQIKQTKKNITSIKDNKIIEIGSLYPNKSKNFDFTIIAEKDLKDTISQTFQLNIIGGDNTVKKKLNVCILPKYPVKKFPPILIADAKFIDNNRNKLLDAFEYAEFVLRIKNTGKGDAWNLKAKLELPNKTINDLNLNP